MRAIIMNQLWESDKLMKVTLAIFVLVFLTAAFIAYSMTPLRQHIQDPAPSKVVGMN